MLKQLRRAWQAARVLPPRAIIAKTRRRLARPWSRQRDLAAARRGEHLFLRRSDGAALPSGDLYSGLLPYRPEPGEVGRLLVGAGLGDAVEMLAREATLHRFDLLGSGLVEVSCFTVAAGLEDYRYVMAPGERRHEQVRGHISRALGLDDCVTGADAAGTAILRERLREYSPIDWHLDFRSGYRWDPEAWHRDITPAEQQGADIKVPWELSRFQHLGVMGLAYLRAEGRPAELLAAEFVLQITDWIVANPPRCGVNWGCPMDAAIRLVNWLWGISFFRDAAGLTTPFRRLLAWNLYQHALYLRGNLENDGAFTGNHYLADLAGIIYVEAACPWLPRSECWLAFGAKELLKEMRRQVYPDGTNFEASTGYHRLAAEIFYACALLLMGLSPERRGAVQVYLQGEELNFLRPEIFPAWFLKKLLGMARYIDGLTMPGGKVPHLGDFDNGRLYKLSPAVCFDYQQGRYREDHADFTPVLAVAGRMFNRGDLLKKGDSYRLDGELLAGNLRPAVREALSKAGGNMTWDSAKMTDCENPVGFQKEQVIFPEEPSTVSTVIEIGLPGAPGGPLPPKRDEPAYYPCSGVAVYRPGPYYVAVSCGPHGSEGWGVHSHNDKLSFHLNVAGLDFIVDPGSFVYTALPDERNNFRSTRFHNTVVLPGNEQNQWLPGPSGIFSLPEQSRATVLEVSGEYFAGLLSGNGFNHRRDFFFSNHGLTIEDRLERAARFELLFNLHPSVKVTEFGEGSFLLKRGGIEVRLAVSAGRDRVRGRLEKGFYSPGYGVKLPAARIAIVVDQGS